MNDKKLSTESYKGVRDFYPKDQAIQNYIFDTMSAVTKKFGYQEYGASILEPSELYEAKSGEEIVNDQTYSFTDRGDRRVTLRPEMTPTVARMVAARRRELSFPLRLFSIPNLFRYERPQRGRLREHWQLNVDIFGVESVRADIEIIAVAFDIMTAFGASSDMFVIKVNSRKLLDRIYQYYSLSADEVHSLSKLTDKKDKMPVDEFKGHLGELLKDKDGVADILAQVIIENDLDALPDKLRESDERKELDGVIEELAKLDIKNVALDSSIVRGFDYYTGIVFEVFDTDPNNNRSLFGGGRYDDLLEIFDAERVPTVGFGMGDVTIYDFIETHNLLPKLKSETDLFICTVTPDNIGVANEIACELRRDGLNVICNLTNKKVGDQIKLADKATVPYMICVGDDEASSRVFQLKNLNSGEETELPEKDIVRFIKTKQNA